MTTRTLWNRARWIAAALAAIALIFWALRPSPVRVDVAVAELGPLQVTVEDDGEVRVRDRYSVTAPVGGRVERLSLRAGDAVQAGTAVARLEPAPLDVRSRTQAERQLEAVRDAQRAAVAIIPQARATLEQARRERDRLTGLERRGVASGESVEKAELVVRVAQSDLDAAQSRAEAAAHDVEVARAALLAAGDNTGRASGPIVVRSPVAGQVLAVPDASARVVAPGQVLLEIGDLSRLEVTVDLLSTDAVKVSPGQSMSIDQWGGDHPLAGRVRLVEPGAFTKVSALGIEEQRVNVLGDLLESARPLGDRYRVQVRIVLWESPRVLKVPWSALFRDAGRWYLYAVDQGYARKREVTVGHQSAADVEILSGLQAGERVVRHPTDQIVDGVRVVTSPVGP
jgi:HlyD family secretion protein